jgi:hypothetical protein
MEIESSAEDMAAAQQDALNPPVWRDWVVLGGAAIALAAICYGISNTALGTWLAEECVGISTLIQKASAIGARLMERVPWPAPEHGAESIWETITILFASVLVRPRAASALAQLSGLRMSSSNAACARNNWFS